MGTSATLAGANDGRAASEGDADGDAGGARARSHHDGATSPPTDDAEPGDKVDDDDSVDGGADVRAPHGDVPPPHKDWAGHGDDNADGGTLRSEFRRQPPSPNNTGLGADDDKGAARLAPGSAGASQTPPRWSNNVSLPASF